MVGENEFCAYPYPRDHITKIENLEKEVVQLKQDVALMQQGKAGNDSYNELRLMIATLDASLKEVIRERKEDSIIIGQLMSDISDVKISMHTVNINHDYTIKTMTVMEEKLDQIIKATTFNWLEVFNNAINDNIIKKILTYGSMALFISSIMGFAYWVFTGDFVLPNILEYIKSSIGG